MTEIVFFFVLLALGLGLIAFPVLAFLAPTLIPLTVITLVVAVLISVLICIVISKRS